MNDTVISHPHEPSKPKAIRALTPEQAAAMPAWRDKWIANGLSCKPMTDDDRTKVEGALRALREANDPDAEMEVPSLAILLHQAAALEC